MGGRPSACCAEPRHDELVHAGQSVRWSLLVQTPWLAEREMLFEISEIHAMTFGLMFQTTT
jgi:hypothetical protein